MKKIRFFKRKMDSEDDNCIKGLTPAYFASLQSVMDQYPELKIMIDKIYAGETADEVIDTCFSDEDKKILEDSDVASTSDDIKDMIDDQLVKAKIDLMCDKLSEFDQVTV